jgi:hypothetical protein
MPFDRLVEGRVEGVATGRGDHQIGRLVQRDQRLLLDETHALGVRLLDVSAEDARDPALAVERDVDQEVDADQPHHFEQRLVERIALHQAGAHLALDHGRAVRDPNRLDRRQARAHRLAPARVAGHQVRLDQAGDDAQVSLQEEAVDQDRNPAAGAAEAA